MPSNDQSVQGKKFLPLLAVGCLVFAAVMGFGTYFVANLFIPKNREAAPIARPSSGSEAPLPEDPKGSQPLDPSVPAPGTPVKTE